MYNLDYFFNRQSLHLSVCSLPQRSTQLRADIYYDIQISLSIIHPSVCLSVWLAPVCSPPPRRGERVSRSLYIYKIYWLFFQSTICTSVSNCSSRGRSSYIDISMIYILSKLRYWFFVMTRLFVMIGVCQLGDWFPSIHRVSHSMYITRFHKVWAIL